VVSSCGAYVWYGNSYAASGVYTRNYNNINGCPSVDTLKLTIYQASQTTQTIRTCEPYTWNGSVYNQSGSYTYATVNDGGCDSTVILNLTVASPPVVSAVAGSISCFGETTTVEVTATGGILPYVGTGSFTKPAGTHVFTVTDAGGCTSSATIEITQPTQIVVVINTTPAYRGADGTATAVAYGGDSREYVYVWNTDPVQYGTTARSLEPGTYALTVTDGNGCTVIAQAVVEGSSPTECNNAYRTYSQGAWGAPANGNNAGVYLNEHFATAYPTGLKIGDCGRYIILTSATAVRNFLPSGSTPRQLNAGTLTNPTRTIYSNVFAGHLVTLNLNITFDSVDAAFGNSATLLKNAIIKTGMFTGWSVQQLYNEANRVIGCGGSTSYLNALKDAVEQINGSWEGGQKSNDYLNCPSNNNINAGQPITDIKDNIKDNVIAYPNPTRDNTRIKYTMSGAGSVAINIYNAQGSIVGTYSSKHSASGEYYMELPMKRKGLSAGVYTVQIGRNGKVDRVRVVVQ
jgi:hypothetical protein